MAWVRGKSILYLLAADWPENRVKAIIEEV